MKAADVMVSPVITIRPDVGIRDAARVMLDHGISGVPVVDAGGNLAGIVSEGDLIRRVEIGTQKHRSWWLELFTSRERLADEFTKAHALKVADVMTRNVVSAGEDASLADIAALLERHGIKRVPIVRDGMVVGIVSRANLLRALASVPAHQAVAVDDATLRERVMEQIRSVPGGMPWLLSVLVQDGIIDLWGPIQSEEQRKAIRVAAEATPGVREVHDNLYRMPTPSV
jgi:CBS domain-containing protein